MANPYTSEIMLFAGNFAPRGWGFCNGDLVAVSQNDALFSLVGTIYGGDGRTTFGLPDLRGRTPVGEGGGPGLSTYRLGEKGGLESVTLTQGQLPVHRHTYNIEVTAGPPNQTSPAGHTLADGVPQNFYSTQAASDPVANPPINVGVPGNTGNSFAHNNLQPYLCVNYCIALFGVYPSRS